MNDFKNIYLIVIIILTFSCAPQTVIFDNTSFCEVLYESDYNVLTSLELKDTSNVKSYLDKTGDDFVLEFATGFNKDSIHVFLNNKLIISKTITSDPSNSFSYRHVIKKIRKRKRLSYLKIELVDKGISIQFPLDIRFNNLNIIKRDEPEDEWKVIWVLTYANFSTMYV